MTLLTRLRARGKPDELADAARRRWHRLVHSGARSPGAGRDVFNLDVHISVSADVRVALESRALSLTDWNVSGHTWVLGRRPDPVDVVNERTWQLLDPPMVERFGRAYGRYLRTFRGHFAAYPPAFALLYLQLGAPTLAIAATRYEWPFTHDAARWRWLDDSLRAAVTDDRLTLVANNRADADYLKHYTGLQPTVIPSACSYVARTYCGRNPLAIVAARRDSFAQHVCDQLGGSAAPLRAALGARYAWSRLYDHRAVVVIPYNVSIMSLFEHYAACAPVYVPTRSFLKQLAAEHPDDVLANLSFTQVTRRPPAVKPEGIDLNDTSDERVIDWYLDRADFYDSDWMPHIQQFESWAHLRESLYTNDHHEISASIAADQPARLRRIADLWDALAWIQALTR